MAIGFFQGEMMEKPWDMGISDGLDDWATGEGEKEGRE
jgi:hypothetical protein